MFIVCNNCLQTSTTVARIRVEMAAHASTVSTSTRAAARLLIREPTAKEVCPVLALAGTSSFNAAAAAAAAVVVTARLAFCAFTMQITTSVVRIRVKTVAPAEMV